SSSSRTARSRQPVVVHRPVRGRSFSWLYLLPAALLSGLFYVGLFGGMFLLTPPTNPPATELANREKYTPIQAEQTPPPPEPENRSSDPFLTPPSDVDPSSEEVDADLDKAHIAEGFIRSEER